jgi:hypothetical protein
LGARLAIGTATITLAPLVVNLRSLERCGNMTFNSVKLASGTTLHFQADPARELRVDLDRAYQPRDELTLVIDYHTNGHAKGGGLQGFGRIDLR